MIETSFWVLFVTGLLGGGHCVGMCGGIVTALTFGLPQGSSRWPYLFAYNLGRIASYIAIGALLGGLAQLGLTPQWARPGQIVLFALANIMIIALGLYLAGLSSAVRLVESAGRPLWRRLQPLAARSLPLRSPWRALGAGAIWGWLPCGLVYSASLSALASGGAMQGALCMAAFGLGTLPNLLAMGAFATTLRQWMQKRPVRLLAGLAVAALGAVQLTRLALTSAL
ncbi:sulfite exporter TauE/SafE family protein [Paludibacterium yongneupense]|uniref:sulfite exporter TauE/SafE family protein n=1 Tax=Paludibacterium yongneupense TaxID=400061 RepID=UPI0004008860|nr:sulfite exporter TauE/SafE family protein [Paludibacterium yongneupense]